MSNDSVMAGGATASARAILEQHGVRATNQRVRVAEMLLTAPRHITAEQILGALREGAGHVSKATVYNTLKLFVDQGLVRQIHVDPERCVYDSMMAPHHHFQLLETGEMIDIRPEDLEFAKMPPLPPGTEIADVEVVIRLRRHA
jgi:Fur family iron response transcriptional regulator